MTDIDKSNYNKVTIDMIKEIVKDIHSPFKDNGNGTFTFYNSDGTVHSIVNEEFLKTFDKQLKENIYNGNKK